MSSPRPGMDRHSAYVGLSRHRDGVELHYGRDDFQNPDQLARQLSRDRAKDMASDDIDTFAERRGIEPPSMEERWKAFVEKVRQRARAVSTIFKRRDDQLPPLAENTEALQRTRRDPTATIPTPCAASSGPTRPTPPLPRGRFGAHPAGATAMQLEGEMRENPDLRADRFVAGWKKLEAASTRAYQAADIGRFRAAKDQMRVMAKSLERDPQFESLVAQRSKELGIGDDMRLGRSVPGAGVQPRYRLGYWEGLGTVISYKCGRSTQLLAPREKFDLKAKLECPLLGFGSREICSDSIVSARRKDAYR